MSQAGETAFGAWLRRQRITAGLTQEELAERSGLSVRAISDMERGRTTRPRRVTLSQITDALELPEAEREAVANAARRMAREAAPTQSALAQLPADLTDFTGRHEQVALLTGLLASAHIGEGAQAVPVSAIAGAAGMGKTALAVHAAHAVAAHFPDGQFYLSMRGSSAEPVPPGNALARLLRDLGTDPAAIPADESERAARYRSLVAGQRLLIVLDDARDAAQVRLLLPGTASCAVLVTSRNSMHDLESARVLELDTLTHGDAAALFARLVTPARTAREPVAVREVLAACGGLPLGIRIAAARIAARPGWSVTTLAERLRDARNRLDELQTGDLAVRASFMVSYANLRPVTGDARGHAASVFRRLALADGSDIGLHAAAVLADLPLAQADQALESLVDAHLLQSAVPHRYRCHDLLRVYATERVLAEEGESQRDEAIHRMLCWYLHTAVAAARMVNPNRTHVTLSLPVQGHAPLAFSSYAEALAWLDSEHSNLVAAVSQAASQREHEVAWKLAVSLWDLFHLRGHWGDWLATHRTALASARWLGDRNAEQWILAHLGGYYQNLADPLASIECLRQALPIQREIGNVRAQAIALHNLGLNLSEVGQVTEAIESLRESLSLFRSAADRNGEGAALNCMGMLHRVRGQFTEAIVLYQEALSAFQETSDLDNECDVRLEMCLTRHEMGEFDAVAREATALIELNRRLGRTYGEAKTAIVLGRAQRDLGYPDKAHEQWLSAHAILVALDHPRAAEVAAELSGLELAGLSGHADDGGEP
jgi:tetratricopeptide (TPR) repeat protein/transcriptional regulator with XRE-family HTH domain